MPLSPRTLRPANTFTPRSISGLALWLDASASGDLYTTDAGPVVPVNEPTEISGCALWLDGADSSAASMTLNGSLVETWKDKSGNNRNATASGTARPTLTGSALNGRSVVTFDGTANQMQIDGTFLVTSNATIFAVARRTSGSFGAVITSKGTGDTSPALQHASGSWQINHAGNLSVIGLQAGYAVLSGTISAGATAAFANGLLQDSDASSGSLASDATKTYIGTYRAAIANVLAGEIAEIIVFNTALSTADRARVEAYLAQRWGITGVHAAATSASDPVGYWRDRSGNGRHATQATGASRPTISSVLRNGRRQLSFDGSDDRLLLGNLSAAFPSAAELFVVMNNMGDTAYEVYATRVGSQGASNSGFGALTFPGAFRTERAGTAQTFLTYSDRVFLWSIRSSSSSYSVGIDGLVQLTVAADFNAGDSHVVGAQSTTAGVNGSLAGRVLEVVAYNKVLTASERTRISNALAAKWGITLAPQVSNADAQDWINRVYANGGTVTASTAAAVNQFCNDIDAAGIRDRFYRLSLMCGGTSGTAVGLNSAMVPLYRGPSLGGPQYGGTVDTNNGPFSGGEYSETLGLLGGGSRWLNTGVTLQGGGLSASSVHLSAVWPTFTQPPSTNVFPIAAVNSAVNDRHWLNCNSNTTPTTEVGGIAGGYGTVSVVDTIAGANGGVSISGGLWTVSRTSASDLRMYLGTSERGSNTTTLSSSFGTENVSVFARWNGSSTFGHFAQRMMAYSVGLGMNAEQIAVYNAAINNFNSAMGRSV